MKRWPVMFITLAAVLLAGAFASGRAVRADHAPLPQPLINCSDINGNGPVSVGDIGWVVSKFGTSYPNANYQPLYDVNAGNGVISVGDIGMTVSDFGLNCAALSPVDTEIARATFAILSHPERDQFLNENAAFLAGQGYFLASTDVPGQGKHYINGALWDGVFSSIESPYLPEGLVYNNGRLVASLTYAEGDNVGWGPEPPDPDQVNIDAFCTPVPPRASCSWSGTEDGFHWHANLCTVAIGHPSAAALPGVASAAACQSLHNTWCGGAKCPNSTWAWVDRSGWMGHLWNHDKVNPNGRLADCAPDETGDWKGFNCPQ